MSRRMIAGILSGLVVGLVVGGNAVAKEPANSKKTKAQAKQAEQAAAQQHAQQEQVLKEQAVLKEWAEKLNGTQWTVELKRRDGGSSQRDTLSFDGIRMLSEQLVKEGYGGSNCTFKIESDGTAIWETIQMKQGGDTVFWRGEIRGTQMSGMLSRQPAQGLPEDYSFNGTKLEVEPPVAAPAQQSSQHTSQQGVVRSD